MTKLPSGVHLIVSREVDEDTWELDKLLKKTVEQKLCARERAVVSIAVPQKKAIPIPSTAATLLTGGTNTKTVCCYCQQPHYSSSCKAVTSVEERKTIL